MLRLNLPGKESYCRMTTEELRAGYLTSGFMRTGELNLIATDLDRAIVGGAVPTNQPLRLIADESMRAAFFCERRELGALNIGGPGSVSVDGQVLTVGTREIAYVGRGSKDVAFHSDDPANPAVFYLLSYTAHKEYPSASAGESAANIIDLGSNEASNARRIVQYIHEEGIKSCQLVMGYTELHTGSVWNTMPCHTHERRSEVYFYFDLPADQRVLHMMGTPQETRALWVADREAVLSPTWSIHCGSGTSNYRFIWGMGGENQRFDDMDGVAIPDLR